MKHLVSLYLSLAVLSGCSDGSDTRPAEMTHEPAAPPAMLIADLTFADHSLADCISRSASENGWRIVDEVTALDCENDFAADRAIFSLEGMEAFSEVRPPALTSLNLKFNQISDASPLSGLTGLTVLELGGWTGNPLTDLWFLAGLVQLQSLSLHSYDDPASFSDIAPLASLTELETLVIEGVIWDYGARGKVSEISPLAQLTKLRNLTVSGQHKLTNLSPLGGLLNLEELDLSSNASLSDLSPISSLANLQKLDIRGMSSIDSLDALSGMSGLTHLVLGNFAVRDLTPLSQLPNLVSLEIYDSGVSDIGPLASLLSLQEFSMKNQDDIDDPYLFLEDISPLAMLPRLTTVSINYNIGMDISVLGDMRQLRILDLADNRLQDIHPLAGLVDLIELDLYGNRIFDLSPLTTLIGLQRLDLRRNPELDCEQISELAAILSDTLIESDGCPLETAFAASETLRRQNLPDRLRPDLRDASAHQGL